MKPSGPCLVCNTPGSPRPGEVYFAGAGWRPCPTCLGLGVVFPELAAAWSPYPEPRDGVDLPEGSS